MNFEKLKEAALKEGITDIESYTVATHGTKISMFNGNIENNTSYQTEASAIRGVYNQQIVTIYEECNDDKMIPSIIHRIKDNCSIINQNDPFFIYEGDQEYPVIEEKVHDFDQFTLEDKANLCLELTKLLESESPYVAKTEVSYSETESCTTIVNSKGLNVKKETKFAILVAEVICEKDGEMQTGFDYLFLSNLKNLSLKQFASKIVKDTVETFGAESIASGTYPVILDRSVVSSLLEAFSNIFSANAVLKNMSFLKDKLNEKIFGENITIIDDPLFKDAPIQVAFDDEGVASRAKTLVEHGVLKTYLHNLKTAAMMNTKSTGNGFKPNEASSLNVLPSNLYLNAGSTSLEEMFEKIGNGVYITDVKGLHAGLNPISGSFNLQSNGFWIENGKKTKPITLIILSGTLQDMLNHVIYVGSDFELKNSVGAPSLAIESLAISGK